MLVLNLPNSCTEMRPQRLRVRPAHVLVQEALLARRVHEVLATDDVRDALQVILDGGLEVQKWPRMVARNLARFFARMDRVSCNDPESRPIPKARMRVGDVGLHPQNGVALLGGAVDHALEAGKIRGDVLPAVGARCLGFLERTEHLGAATADVGAAAGDEIPGRLLVDCNAVAGHDFAAGGAPDEPLEVVADHLVAVPAARLIPQGRLDLWVRIVETQDEFCIVHALVFCKKRDASAVPKGQRAVRVGGEPHDDLALHVRERLEADALLLLLHVDEFWCFCFEDRFLCVQGHGVDDGACRLKGCSDGARVRPEFRVPAHDTTDQAFRFALAAMLEGVLQAEAARDDLQRQGHDGRDFDLRFKGVGPRPGPPWLREAAQPGTAPIPAWSWGPIPTSQAQPAPHPSPGHRSSPLFGRPSK